MGRFFANENFPFPTVEVLRTLGHDITTVQETRSGAAKLSDDEVVRFATTDARAVLTLNRRDFVRIHLRDARHAGIVVCTFDVDFEALARRIDETCRATGDLTGQLIRVVRPTGR